MARRPRPNPAPSSHTRPEHATLPALALGAAAGLACSRGQSAGAAAAAAAAGGMLAATAAAAASAAAGRRRPSRAELPIPAAELTRMRQSLHSRGYGSLQPGVGWEWGEGGALLRGLRAAADALRAAGYPPAFVFMLDGAWEVHRRAGRLPWWLGDDGPESVECFWDTRARCLICCGSRWRLSSARGAQWTPPYSAGLPPHPTPCPTRRAPRRSVLWRRRCRWPTRRHPSAPAPTSECVLTPHPARWADPLALLSDGLACVRCRTVTSPASRRWVRRTDGR